MAQPGTVSWTKTGSRISSVGLKNSNSVSGCILISSFEVQTSISMERNDMTVRPPGMFSVGRSQEAGCIVVSGLVDGDQGELFPILILIF